MQSDEMWTLETPMGLFHRLLKIHRVRQALVQQCANFNPTILRYVILCIVHLGLWWRLVKIRFHIAFNFLRIPAFRKDDCSAFANNLASSDILPPPMNASVKTTS